MTRTITLIPGDGIGPEVTRAVVRVVEATGPTPEWETFKAGDDALEEHGTTLPPELLASITRNKIALKGPITTPVGTGFTSVNVALRKALGSMGSELNGAPQPIAGPPRLAAAAAEQMSQAWRPWRAYAVIRAWSQLGTAPVSTRRKPLSNQESRHET